MGGRHGRIRARPAVPRDGATTAPDPAAVRACLQSYADRGVFRGFTELPARGPHARFRFGWLARTPYDLTYAARTGTFTFVNVLPNMPARSALARALRTFVEGRSSSELPLHRRIEPRHASVRAFVRQGAMRLEVVAKPGHHAYGANRIVNLVHEVYLHLGVYYPEYLWDEYGLSQD